MKKNENLNHKQILEPLLKSKKTIDGKEVSLEELESLCSSFDKRPRGCNAESAEAGFTSTGDNDDVLF